MTRGIRVGRELYAGHVRSRSPFGVGRSEAYDCRALLTNQVFAGDADGPSEACRLRDNLVGSVD